jgi:hypothetical protein
MQRRCEQLVAAQSRPLVTRLPTPCGRQSLWHAARPSPFWLTQRAIAGTLSCGAPMTLSWDFKQHPAYPKNRPRPFATVALGDGGGLQSLWHEYALVDSGAEDTLFPRSFMPPGTALDFSATHADRGVVKWRGQQVAIWFHEVQVVLADRLHADGSPIRKIVGTGRIGFWQDRDPSGKPIPLWPYPLLGQGGILEYLVFTEYAGQGLFELRPDSNAHGAWQEM